MRTKLFCLLISVISIDMHFVVGQTSNLDDATSPDFQSIPALDWKFKANAPIFSSPVIYHGVVYAGALDSTLYAIQIETGKVEWKFKTGGEIRSTVCLYEDKLYLYSGDGSLYAISRTGKLLWSFKTLGGILGDRRHDFADYFQSSPVADNRYIFFGAGDGRLYALNASDGQLIWCYKTNGVLHTTPAPYKDRVFIGSFDGHMYALAKADGQLLWKFKTIGHRYFPDGEVQGTPVVANDRVYFGARDYKLYALDAMNGHAHWDKSFPFGWALAVRARDSVIYVGTSDDRVLVALDGKSGNELWRTPVKFNIFGPCTYSKSMAYVGTLMGKLYAIDLKDGKVKWSYSTEGYQKNHLKYFKPDDTFRDDITKIVKSPADFISMEYGLGAIFSTPLITNDRLIISSTEGSIYCLKR